MNDEEENDRTGRNVLRRRGFYPISYAVDCKILTYVITVCIFPEISQVYWEYSFVTIVFILNPFETEFAAAAPSGESGN